MKRLRHFFVVLYSKHLARCQRNGDASWTRLEQHFLKTFPTCAACGSPLEVQAHHIDPHPRLRLNPGNLIALCMGLRECHLKIGHGGNFRTFNPNASRHAIEAFTNPKNRSVIESRAWGHALRR